MYLLKFCVSSIILTSIRQGVILHPTPRQNKLKKPIKIKVTWNQAIQYKSICTLLSCVLVFYTYLRQYFCYLYIICFLLKFIPQSYQSMLLYHHVMPSNDFLLIHTYQDKLHIPHPLLNVNYVLNKYH